MRYKPQTLHMFITLLVFQLPLVFAAYGTDAPPKSKVVGKSYSPTLQQTCTCDNNKCHDNFLYDYHLRDSGCRDQYGWPMVICGDTRGEVSHERYGIHRRVTCEVCAEKKLARIEEYDKSRCRQGMDSCWKFTCRKCPAGYYMRHQKCRHCPIHTIVNSRHEANGGSECFDSCSEAYEKTSATYLNWENRQFKAVRIIPNPPEEIENWVQEGDVTLFYQPYTAFFPLDAAHSVVQFEDGELLKNWNEITSFTDYVKFTQKSAGDRRLLAQLPPPPRTCKSCEYGKSAFSYKCTDSGNTGPSEACKQLQNNKVNINFAHRNDISWIGADDYYYPTKISICRNCPVGTFFDRYDQSESAFDWADPTESTWLLKELRCKPCEYGKYQNLTGATTCKLCGRGQYVVSKDLPVFLQYQAHEKNYQLLQDCSFCPPQTELWEKGNSYQTCSGGEHLKNSVTKTITDWSKLTTTVFIPNPDGCCKPCDLNSHSTGESEACIPDNLVPTRVPYGDHGAKITQCPDRFQKKSCAALPYASWSKWNNESSPCTDIIFGQSTSSSNLWTTCVPCLDTEKTDSSTLNNPMCLLCNADDSGEFWNEETKKCEACNNCEVMEVDFEIKSFQWEPQLENIYKSQLPKFGITSENKWRYQDVTQTCKPLSRRTITFNDDSQNFTITGKDSHKVEADQNNRRKGKLYQEKNIDPESYSAVQYDQMVDNKPVCTLKSCDKFCQYPQYSDGCGDESDPWVRLTSTDGVESDKRYTQLLNDPGQHSTTFYKNYTILHHGKCQNCKECNRGEFNAECNVFGPQKRGDGICQKCTTSCDPSYFLWHEDGVRGCDPPWTESRTILNTKNYKCKECPTWFKKEDKGHSLIYTILGCGKKNSYNFRSLEKQTFSAHQAQTYTSQEITSHYQKGLIEAEADQHHKGVGNEFKAIYYYAKYCPDGYFFEIPREIFKDEKAFTLEKYDKDIKGFGMDEYNLNYCKKCKSCDPSTMMISESKWRKCDGSTTTDTEEPGCVSKCQSGFFESNISIPSESGSQTQDSCKPCTACLR